MELESEDEDKDNLEGDKDELERSHIMEELWLEGVQLPPEPTGQCSAELQVSILIFQLLGVCFISPKLPI